MSIGTRPAWRELLEIEGYGVDEGSSGGWIKNQQQPPGRGGKWSGSLDHLALLVAVTSQHLSGGGWAMEGFMQTKEMPEFCQEKIYEMEIIFLLASFRLSELG